MRHIHVFLPGTAVLVCIVESSRGTQFLSAGKLEDALWGSTYGSPPAKGYSLHRTRVEQVEVNHLRREQRQFLGPLYWFCFSVLQY